MKAFGNIAKDGQVRAIASGALTDGKAVIVNSDGTVSVVGGTSRSQVLGTETSFESGNSRYIAAAYDANAQKVVISYQDFGNSAYGTAVVGDVSGASISFGTPVVFESAQSEYTSVTYDANAQKFVIAYRDSDNSDRGTAIVGTVDASNNSISFGSPTVFETGNTVYISTAYDSSNGRIVVSYRDIGNSSYGTAIVGTISGTSVSFGTAVVFASAESNYINSVYDSNAQKIFIGYTDGGNGDYPTGIVGTVDSSDNSISFGSETAVASHLSNYLRVGFDSTNNKVVIAYRNRDDSDTGYASVGTISGTSVSFGTSVKFSGSDTAIVGESSSAISFDTTSGGILIAYEGGTDRYATVIRGVISNTSISFDTPVVIDTGGAHQFIGIVYDPDEDRHVVFYRDSAQSNYGLCKVYSPAYSSSNLTSENFIGFSDGAFADTQSASINTANTIDRNQSSLTAGQTYFVQTDGTLGLTAADPSVTAGTAISATELIVKG